jgi:hypothetical protein
MIFLRYAQFVGNMVGMLRIRPAIPSGIYGGDNPVNLPVLYADAGRDLRLG